MHMISKKDLNSAELETVMTSRSPTTVTTVNGEVQTHEEATVYVKELEKFLTMKVLEDTPAVLSLGKICDELGYLYELINGQKPHLTKNGIRIQCCTENFVPIVVPGLSTSSSSSLPSSTSMTPSRQEIYHPTSSSSSSTSPTMTSSTVSSERVERQERWDRGDPSSEASERLKLRDLPEDKNYKGPMQKTQWRNRTSSRKFWYLKVLSEGCESRNNHRYAVVCAWAGYSMDPVLPVQNKNFTGNPEEPNEVLGAEQEAKSHWHWQFLEFGTSSEELSWNHCTSTPHRSETNGTAQRAVRRVKEGTSAVLLQSGLNESWWAESMECYTYLRDVTDHLKDRLFHLVHWLSIILQLRRTSQESINLERKSFLDCSSDTRCTRGEFGRVTYWLQTLRSWRRWTHRKSTRQDSMRKRWYFPKKENLFSSRRWTNQTFCKRSGTENIHLDAAATNSSRKSHRFSWRIRSVHFHHLKTHFWMPVKR